MYDYGNIGKNSSKLQIELPYHTAVYFCVNIQKEKKKHVHNSLNHLFGVLLTLTKWQNPTMCSSKDDWIKMLVNIT